MENSANRRITCVCLALYGLKPTAVSSLQNLRFLQITADQTVPLRHSVLWPNAPVSHVLLPEDSAGWHYGAFIEGEPHAVAVISLFAEARPIDNGAQAPEADERAANNRAPGKAIRFRKFACNPAHQGRGIGTNLLRHAISVAGSELGGRLLWCDARQATQGWYERRGLAPFGDVFWKGPVKYVRMSIDIDTV
ncbi:GCN5-related N-acetyltransferase [Mycena belliarum]|uniref:GCN5-related N-acetyltransferase n=1 Tax=Mycena belliarum TaxID=1033014 RepID=A0AAD6UKD3_9AGAR|nr:GCN5-related N-acetyltransferase [Mycena belliae]